MFFLGVFALMGLLAAAAIRLFTRDAWSRAGLPGRLHLVSGWALTMLGIIHVAATPVFHDRLTGAALWFASGGVAMSVTGGMNVLRVLYAGVAPGVRYACIAANLAMLVLASTFAWRAGAAMVNSPQYGVLLVLVAMVFALSLRR